jgi:hypothetical protein
MWSFLLNLQELKEIRKISVQAYGDNAMKKTAVYKLVTRFSQVTACVIDEETQRRPATSRTEENTIKFRQIVRVKSIAEQVNIDRRNSKILTEDLDMRKVCPKRVSKELTGEQKNKGVFS